MADNDAPGVWPVWTPRGMLGRSCKEEYYILQHTKYERSRPCGLGKEDFFIFHFKSLWELSVAMETRVLIRQGLKPPTFHPPQ